MTLAAGGVESGVTALAVATRLEQPQALLQAIENFVVDADIDTAQHLDNALPRFSLTLCRLSARIAETVVAGWRERVVTDRTAYLPRLAASVSALAVRLAAAGRRREALSSAQEAVDLRRELAALNRDAYLPELATSVNNLANRLAEAGRSTEALTTVQEAVDFHRELAALNRDAYLPDLATSVNNLAIRLGEDGRRVQALATAQEAVDLYRELAAHEPGHFGDSLAGAEGTLKRLRKG